jgi:hypothetical protein
LLAAICEALGAALSEVLRDVSDQLATSEVPAPAPAAEPVPEPVPAAEARIAAQPTASIAALAERKLSVAVHRNGPLQTTLRATRATAKDREPAYV